MEISCKFGYICYHFLRLSGDFFKICNVRRPCGKRKTRWKILYIDAIRGIMYNENEGFLPHHKCLHPQKIFILKRSE